MSKVIKNRKGREIISRDLIFDNTISDRARFIYCYMMAKPDNWDFLMQPMAEELGYSVETLRKYINELAERGWITKGEQKREEGNLFGAVCYIIHENRVKEKSVEENFRHGKNQAQESIYSIDTIHTNEDGKKEKEDITISSKKPKFHFYAALVEFGIDAQIADDWIKIRKSKKASDSETALSQIKNALDIIKNTYGISYNDAIRICVTNGWYGCKPSYFENIKLKDYGIEAQMSLFESKNETKWQ